MRKSHVKMKSFLLTVSIAIASLKSLRAQSFNPGYLGLKQTISIESTISPCNALTGSKLLENNFGINYEKVFKKTFGLQIGIQKINGHINQTNAEYYDGYWINANSTNRDYMYPVNTSVNYGITELNITPKFYFTEKGAVAPYGDYFGIDIGYGFAKIKDPVDVGWRHYSWSGTSVTPNSYYVSTPWKTHKALTLGFNFGKRRFISSTPISVFYQVNFAYIMAQTTAENLAYLDGEIYNHQDLLESFMIRNYGNKKLIQFKFGLGYSF